MKSHAVRSSSRGLVVVLAVGMALAAQPVRDARSQAAVGMAMGGISLAAGMIGIASGNFAQSIGNCTNLAANAGTPGMPAAVGTDKGFWAQSGSCALAALNVAAIAGGIMAMMQSGSTKDAASGASSAAPIYDPHQSIADQLCSQDPAKCGCSGADASNNFICTPNGLDKLAADLGTFKDAVNAGLINPPDGKTKDDLLTDADNALGSITSALAGVSGTGSPEDDGVDGTGFGDFSGARKVAGAGAGTAGDSSGGGGDFSGFDSKGRAGPADRTGLGKAIIMNGLEMADDVTGKSLTIWQRTTRRHQGEGGLRAFTLARQEFIRKQALKLASTQHMPASKVAEATPAVKAVAPSRAPASIPVRAQH